MPAAGGSRSVSQPGEENVASTREREPAADAASRLNALLGVPRERGVGAAPSPAALAAGTRLDDLQGDGAAGRSLVVSDPAADSTIDLGGVPFAEYTPPLQWHDRASFEAHLQRNAETVEHRRGTKKLQGFVEVNSLDDSQRSALGIPIPPIVDGRWVTNGRWGGKNKAFFYQCSNQSCRHAVERSEWPCPVSTKPRIETFIVAKNEHEGYWYYAKFCSALCAHACAFDKGAFMLAKGDERKAGLKEWQAEDHSKNPNKNAERIRLASAKKRETTRAATMGLLNATRATLVGSGENDSGDVAALLKNLEDAERKRRMPDEEFEKLKLEYATRKQQPLKIVRGRFEEDRTLGVCCFADIIAHADEFNVLFTSQEDEADKVKEIGRVPAMFGRNISLARVICLGEFESCVQAAGDEKDADGEFIAFEYVAQKLGFGGDDNLEQRGRAMYDLVGRCEGNIKEKGTMNYKPGAGMATFSSEERGLKDDLLAQGYRESAVKELIRKTRLATQRGSVWVTWFPPGAGGFKNIISAKTRKGLGRVVGADLKKPLDELQKFYFEKAINETRARHRVKLIKAEFADEEPR